MELLYQTLASENCVKWTILLLGGFGVAGALGGLLLWFFLLREEGLRQLLMMAGGGAVLLSLFASVIVISGSETVVNISFNSEILEYKYCSRAKLYVNQYPLTDILSKKYRKKITPETDERAKKVEHYLDIYLKNRAEPLSIQLSSTSGVRMKAAEKFASNVMQEYQAQR